MGFFKDCGCGCGGRKGQDKFVVALIAALVFFLVASPEMFQVTRRIFGTWVSGPTGCSSTGGLALHAIVFFFVTWGIMNLHKDVKKEESGSGCGCGK